MLKQTFLLNTMLLTENISKLINHIEASNDDQEILIILVLLCLLKNPECIKKQDRKTFPNSNLAELINIILLRINLVSNLFKAGQCYRINDDIFIEKVLDRSGLLSLKLCGLSLSKDKVVDIKAKSITHKYDVCMSFSSKDRDVAKNIVKHMKNFYPDIRVFFDQDYEIELNGNDLYLELQRIYATDSRYCVLVYSEQYAERMWTNHEFKSIQTRILNDKKLSDYLYLIITDDSSVPSELERVAYHRYEKSVPGNKKLKNLAKKICDDVLAPILEVYFSEDESVSSIQNSQVFNHFINDFWQENREITDRERIKKLILILIILTKGKTVKELKALFLCILYSKSIYSLFDSVEKTYALSPNFSLYLSDHGEIYIKKL